MGLVRRIKKALGLLARPLQKPPRPPPQRDEAKFDPWAYISSMAVKPDSRPAFYYADTLARRERSQDRERPKLSKGELVHNARFGTLEMGRNEFRRDVARRKKAARAKRRKERRAA